MNINSKMTISDLLDAHPSTIGVFIRRKMLCVGCPTESFHTLEDVARIYGIAIQQFLRELQKASDARSRLEDKK